MSQDEGARDLLDAIVIGFDDEDRILATLTAPMSNDEIKVLKGCRVTYEDFKGVVWEGRVIDVQEDALIIEFSRSALSEGGPSGLGQGSLLRIQV